MRQGYKSKQTLGNTNGFIAVAGKRLNAAGRRVYLENISALLKAS
jgi:hypothetical protein